jgi:hypothetical protein
MKNKKDIPSLIHPLRYKGKFTAQEAEDNKLPRDIQMSMFQHLYDYNDETMILNNFPQLKFYKHSILVDTKNIIRKKVASTDYNTSWVGDGNPKVKEVHQSMEDAGYRLRKYAPIALFKSKEESKYELLDGRTRFTKLDFYKYQNIIADVYEANPVSTPGQVMFAREKIAGAANIQGVDARGVMRQKDIIFCVSRAYKNGWIEKGPDGLPDKDQVRDTILSICGDSKFQERTIEKLINQIINSALDIETGKRFWEHQNKILEWLTNESEGRKYYNSSGYHYQLIEVSDARRSIEIMTSAAKKNPGKKVRIIMYKKYCDSSDPVKDFKESMYNYCQQIENTMNDIGKIFFSGCDHNLNNEKVFLYGAVPSLASMGSLDRLWLYDGATGADFDSTFTQKSE